MSRREKLLSRLYLKPKDFTWNELCTLLRVLGWKQINSKSGSSRVKFVSADKNDRISLHRPHPGNIVKHYMLEQVIEKIDQKGKKS